MQEFRFSVFDGLKKIEGSVTGLTAMLEGMSEMEGFLNQQSQAARTVAEIRSQIDALSRQTATARDRIKADQGYLSLLAAVTDARRLCLTQARP